ncbi:unnamed protein product, partial [Mesorhabditis belari]|uniref:Uncharacterized protein n=1 Tax=Mesorhabditis belari TaxID=2138241 RepID=A0AAF3EHY7_9BILA
MRKIRLPLVPNFNAFLNTLSSHPKSHRLPRFFSTRRHKAFSINYQLSITRQIINSSKAPPVIGPYSQAVRVNDSLYLFGSLGLHPEKGTAGIDYNNVVKTTVFLADIYDYNARAGYQVAVLPKNALVEIEAIATIGKIVDKAKGRACPNVKVGSINSKIIYAPKILYSK